MQADERDAAQRGNPNPERKPGPKTMSKLHQSVEFSGIDTEPTQQTGTDRLPDAYRTALLSTTAPPSEVMTLNEGIEMLERQFGVTEAPTGYYDTEAEEWVEVGRHKAIVNPAWLGDGREESPRGSHGGRDPDALWNLFTDSYEPAGPRELYGPLSNAVSRLDAAEDSFGQVRLYRDGGALHMDLFFTDKTVEIDGEEITLGISTGHDYFGSRTLYAEAIGLHERENGTALVYRKLSDRFKRKHTGSARDDVIKTWGGLLSRLDEITDDIYSVMADAMNYEVDLSEYPIETPADFFDNLGLPRYIAEHAAKRVRLDQPETAFRLYRIGTWAVSKHMAQTNTSAFRSHIAAVNKLLFSPPSAEKQVLVELRKSLIETAKRRKMTGQQTVADADPDEENADALSVAEIRNLAGDIKTRISDIDDAVGMYGTVKERLEGMLSGDIETDEDDEGESASAPTAAAIIEDVLGSTDAASSGEIAEHADFGAPHARRTLAAMHENGRVEREREGRGYVYSLPEQEQEQDGDADGDTDADTGDESADADDEGTATDGGDAGDETADTREAIADGGQPVQEGSR